MHGGTHASARQQRTAALTAHCCTRTRSGAISCRRVCQPGVRRNVPHDTQTFGLALVAFTCTSRVCCLRAPAAEHVRSINTRASANTGLPPRSPQSFSAVACQSARSSQTQRVLQACHNAGCPLACHNRRPCCTCSCNERPRPAADGSNGDSFACALIVTPRSRVKRPLRFERTRQWCCRAASTAWHEFIVGAHTTHTRIRGLAGKTRLDNDDLQLQN